MGAAPSYFASKQVQLYNKSTVYVYVIYSVHFSSAFANKRENKSIEIENQRLSRAAAFRLHLARHSYVTGTVGQRALRTITQSTNAENPTSCLVVRGTRPGRARAAPGPLRRRRAGYARSRTTARRFIR